MYGVHCKLLWLLDAKQEESGMLTGLMLPFTGVYSYRIRLAFIRSFSYCHQRSKTRKKMLSLEENAV